MLAEEQLEGMYAEWLDSGASLDECNRYGTQRAAFYAGVAAGTAYVDGQLEATGSSPR